MSKRKKTGKARKKIEEIPPKFKKNPEKWLELTNQYLTTSKNFDTIFQAFWNLNKNKLDEFDNTSHGKSSCKRYCLNQFKDRQMETGKNRIGKIPMEVGGGGASTGSIGMRIGIPSLNQFMSGQSFAGLKGESKEEIEYSTFSNDFADNSNFKFKSLYDKDDNLMLYAFPMICGVEFKCKLSKSDQNNPILKLTYDWTNWMGKGSENDFDEAKKNYVKSLNKNEFEKIKNDLGCKYDSRRLFKSTTEYIQNYTITIDTDIDVEVDFSKPLFLSTSLGRQQYLVTVALIDKHIKKKRKKQAKSTYALFSKNTHDLDSRDEDENSDSTSSSNS